MDNSFRKWEEIVVKDAYPRRVVVERIAPPRDIVVMSLPKELRWLDEMKAGEVLVVRKDWNHFGLSERIREQVSMKQMMEAMQDQGIVVQVKANDCVMFLSYEYIEKNNCERLMVEVFQDGVIRKLFMYATMFMDIFKKLESS